MTTDCASCFKKKKKKKTIKKGFAGEALALCVMMVHQTLKYKKLIRCPSSIVKLFSGIATAEEYRTYYETINTGNNLDWFRDLQKNCNKHVSILAVKMLSH